MPGKMIECSNCSKVMRSDNLGRHKKTCRSKIGSGLLYPPTSSSFLSSKRQQQQESKDRSKLDTTKQMGMGSRSYSSNDDCDGAEDLMDTESEDSDTSGDDYDGEESNGESDSEEEDNDTSDDDNEENIYVWYIVYQSCKTKDGEHFLEACAGLMGLYVRSKQDVLFEEIMNNTSKLEADGMKFEEALAAAVLKHKVSIILKVNRCKLDGKDDDKRKLSESDDDEDDDDGDEIWCELSQRPVKPWCKWFSGETCNCKNCKSTCILRMVAWFAYVFHAIEEDDLASKISEKLEKCQDLYDELIPIVKQYRKDILAKYAIVKDKLSDSDGIVKSPRKLTSLLNYVDENKDL
tara:strand:- start:13 stop:1059 length:1047 start_codon:yes stop_codon:yes gene_type:complete